MPLNDRKVIGIILEECGNVPSRCAGYQAELREVIAEIITWERQHQVQRGEIQQKVTGKLNATARMVARGGSEAGTGQGGKRQ